MLSNSGMNEYGGVSGGQLGDQTGLEWQIMGWYSYPWDCVLRHPDKKVGEKLAEISRKAAENDLIGYDQSNRLSYWYNLADSNYDPSQITIACEGDCSAGVAANIKATGYQLNIPELQEFPETAWTGVMREYARQAGFKILTDDKFLKSDEYLRPGDILLNDLNHVAVNLDKGSGMFTSKAKQAVPADFFSSKLADNYRVRITCNLRTDAGVKASEKIMKLKRGTIVTNYGYYSKYNKQIWYYVETPSGVVGYVRKKYIKRL